MKKEIKVATFNVEWMVKLFKPASPRLLTKSAPTPGLGSRPKDPQGVANRIAAVIRDVDADILGICEGPPLQAQMEAFVREKLDGDYLVYTMEDGVQSVHTLVHKRLASRVKVSQLPRNDVVFSRLRNPKKPKQFYQFGSVTTPSTARFTRLPVVLRLEYKGNITEIMTLHTKSKFSDLKKASDWKSKNKEKVISAIKARQKLSMEMNAIRKYIAYRLYSQKAQGVIVMGDFNDGISRDVVDETYLLHSIIHELRGAFHHDIALMRHVLNSRQLKRKSEAWTVEFHDAAQGGKKVRVLLDHILYSPECHKGGNFSFVPNSGMIEHKVFKKHLTNSGKTRDDRPSDHIPLSAKFQLR